MSSSSLLTSLAIPVGIAAVAMANLVGAFDGFANLFFGLGVAEQMSVLALVFSTIFASVVLAQHLNGNPARCASGNGNTPTYPLEQMMAFENDKDKFKAVYPSLCQELLTHMRDNNEMKTEAMEWTKRMMDYTVPGGKLNRGTTVVSVFRTLSSGKTLSETQIAKACVLGWSIEFLQAFFLVADDVMDDSQTRRGQPCWYKNNNVKMIAINDSFILESFVFTLLKNHFSQEPYYHDLVDLFLNVIQKTEFGQLLDLTSQPMDAKPNLNRFTLTRYQQIVKYKTAYYTFYLPVAIGMICSGVTSQKAFTTAEKICCSMGEYFQVQDDYLDAYGDVKVIGKIGTDIQDNKCSWLVVQALEKASPKQRKVLEENYGKWDDAKVQRVKELYKEMGLEQIFKNYEEQSFKDIQAELDTLTLMPRDVFELLLKKIYKRSK